MKRLTITRGVRFGRLRTVYECDPIDGRRAWLCVCDCGAQKVIRLESLRSGYTTTCGCGRDELIRQRSLKHGHTCNRTLTSEYRAWRKAIERCENLNCARYAQYGGRGIFMCEEWRYDFAAFLLHVGKRPAGKSLDRINVDGGYVPGNVRWATSKQQHNNKQNSFRISLRGKTLTCKQWAERFDVNYTRLHGLLRYKGKTLSQAVRILRG